MKIYSAVLLLFFIGLLFGGCHSGSDTKPVISSDKYKIADGFEMQLAASEPLIEAPVTMDFDDQGRIWVAEMKGYMPNLAGTGEDVPNGRITILEDLDKDGVAEHSKVFLDSLILPRALAHLYGGLLYAAPPNLWFVEINNDKPGKRTLVDSMYSDGGNVEAQPNGLMMNIDNWIYSANANFRYQLKDGKWIKEPTSFRGQWGISKDDFGRLYYNYNEIQIAADYVLPNTLINNPYLKPKEAINKVLTDNQKVYPLHTTTVNRGYVKGILDKDSILVNFTAACAPLIYRGDQFPDNYYQNAFVCEPQANLVKRDILSFDGVRTTATQAWNDKEFIASTDEGFRPVNLFDGPDGAMYLVDMHRGIMQHRADATPYYRHRIAAKKIDTILHEGRIFRIKSKDKNLSKIPEFNSASGKQLVSFLKNKNGWVRDRAQQLLIYKQQKSVIDELKILAGDVKNPVTAIHALHTLDGLNALSFDLLQKIATSADPMLSAHALVLLEKYNTKDNIKRMVNLSMDLLSRTDSVIHLYLAISLGPWAKVSHEQFLPILARLSQIHSGSPIYAEAIVSSLGGLEEEFRLRLNTSTSNKSRDEQLNKLLSETIKSKHEGKKNPIFVDVSVPMYGRQNGLILFRSTCATCHGPDGDGIENVAPPLKGSEYVEGSTDRLAMIILNGLEGPIRVNRRLYKFNGSMPVFSYNYNDKEIADIIEYLHNSFVSTPKGPVTAEKIKNVRSRKSGILSEKELLQTSYSKD